MFQVFPSKCSESLYPLNLWTKHHREKSSYSFSRYWKGAILTLYSSTKITSPELIILTRNTLASCVVLSSCCLCLIEQGSRRMRMKGESCLAVSCTCTSCHAPGKAWSQLGHSFHSWACVYSRRWQWASVTGHRSCVATFFQLYMCPVCPFWLDKWLAGYSRITTCTMSKVKM